MGTLRSPHRSTRGSRGRSKRATVRGRSTEGHRWSSPLDRGHDRIRQVRGLALARLRPGSQAATGVTTFLLIDYKGGSTFTLARRLPHCVGVVSDLDPALAERALRSLRAEVKRRESAPRLRVRHHPRPQRRHLPRPVSRLVVVVDEFRVLAQEIPSFFDGLVRLAAVGRSLGIHLFSPPSARRGAITPTSRPTLAPGLLCACGTIGESVQVIGDQGFRCRGALPALASPDRRTAISPPVRACHITRILPTPVEEPTRFDPVLPTTCLHPCPPKARVR